MVNLYTDVVNNSTRVISGYGTIMLQNTGAANATVLGSAQGSTPTPILANGGGWTVVNVPTGIASITIDATGTTVSITAY